MLQIPNLVRNGNLLTVTVHLEQDVRGGTHITYSPAVLRARPGDEVKWECNAGPFVIQFLQSAPLGKVNIHSSGSSGSHETAQITAPDGAPRGRHTYAVAVYSESEVHIDAGCPEIIIED